VAWTHLDDKADAFGDQIADLEISLLCLLAPDLAALRFEMDRLREPDGTLVSWAVEIVEPVYADIARLMPTGA